MPEYQEISQNFEVNQFIKAEIIIPCNTSIHAILQYLFIPLRHSTIRQCITSINCWWNRVTHCSWQTCCKQRWTLSVKTCDQTKLTTLVRVNVFKL